MLQLAIVIIAGHLVFGVAWPGDWFALAVFTALGVVCFASLGVALSHAIPNSESAPAYVNAVFLPMLMIAGVFYDEENAPAVLRDIAEVLPLKHLVDGLSGAIVARRGRGPARASRCSCWRCGPPPGSCSPIRGFSWDARRALAGVEHVGRAARRRSGPAGGPRRRCPPGSGPESRIARCGALASHIRTIASGVLDEPQP